MISSPFLAWKMVKGVFQRPDKVSVAGYTRLNRHEPKRKVGRSFRNRRLAAPDKT